MDQIDEEHSLDITGLACVSLRACFVGRDARATTDWRRRAGDFETMGQIGTKHRGFI
jgi:hypothetical protein